MTTNQLMTWGAIAFAAFAAYTVLKSKTPPMTAQQQRDNALRELFDRFDEQSEWGGASLNLSAAQLNTLLPNPFGTYTLGATA